MQENSLSSERVFNLGDYKSFRAKSGDLDLPLEERNALMVESVCDTIKQFLLHQLASAKLFGKDPTLGKEADIWQDKISDLEEIRLELLEEV
jgi:hypothetical protein